mgnify:CR=1 FL=1
MLGRFVQRPGDIVFENSDRFLQAARLAALDDYQILDTPEEAGFDDIVQIASNFCQTPVSLVSFVEVGRQWFKARVGFEACETPIEQSVCAHALRQTDLLVIPDLTADPRTRNNTLVTQDPFIRFYAGAPLITPEGVVIGTLCVIDTVPRPTGLTEPQQQVLRALARQVMMQLELRRLVSKTEEDAQRHSIDLRASLELARNAEEAGGIGTFQVDVRSGIMTVSPEYCRIFGLPLSDTYPASVSEALVLAEDQSAPSNDQTRRSGSAEAAVEYRIRRPDDGAVRWIARRAEFVRDSSGNVARMFGVVQDITERRRQLDRQHALLEAGDRLRDVGTVAEAIEVASRALGGALGASRAGYLRLDPKMDRVEVLRDWTDAGVASLVGQHTRGLLPASLERLAAGVTMSVGNVDTVLWLGRDRDAYRSHGVAAVINVPLLERRELAGVLFVHQTEPRAWSREEIDFATEIADRTHSVISRLEAQANQATLNRELGHRLKNQLAMVQAIVNHSQRPAPDLATASRSLNARIHVLAKAHALILLGESGRTSVDQIVHDITLLHDDRIEQRIAAKGPAIMVGSRPALSLSLILHELSTNAAKYGSLSTPVGSVAINWRVERNEAAARFLLSWKESGGPPVNPPATTGSGTRLIRAGLAGTFNSSVTVDYEPDGVRCTIAADLASFQAE